MTIILILLSGIGCGYLLRNKKTLIRYTDKMLTYSIYLLLFLLGISVGNNQTIITNFAEIGFKAILLSTSGVLGTIILALFVYKIFFLEKNEK